MSRYFTDPRYSPATVRGASHINTGGIARPAAGPVQKAPFFTSPKDKPPAENAVAEGPAFPIKPFQLKPDIERQRSYQNWQVVQQQRDRTEPVTQPVISANDNAAAPIQLAKLNYATGENYKLRTHQGTGAWMALIELAPWGGEGWHLSIFPTGQESWTGNYKPVKGNYKAVYSQKWMDYNEFHITDDKGTHFFYTDGCVPIEAGTHGESAPWGNPLWASANYLVAMYFSRDQTWLNNYVASQIAEKKEQKKNFATEEQIWKEYLEAAKHDASLGQPDGWDRFKASYQHQ